MRDDILDCITITGLTREPARKEEGRRIIAHFDVEITGVRVRGCALIRTASDGLAVSTHTGRDPRCSIEFTSDAIRNAVMARAREAYKALGGTDLPEWTIKPEGAANVASAA